MCVCVCACVCVCVCVCVRVCVFAHILQVDDEAAMSAGLSEQLARITGIATGR